jgi:hypothetical protein
VAVLGPKTDGPMAPDIPLDAQRPAEFIFEGLVKRLSVELKERARVDNDAA